MEAIFKFIIALAILTAGAWISFTVGHIKGVHEAGEWCDVRIKWMQTIDLPDPCPEPKPCPVCPTCHICPWVDPNPWTNGMVTCVVIGCCTLVAFLFFWNGVFCANVPEQRTEARLDERRVQNALRAKYSAREWAMLLRLKFPEDEIHLKRVHRVLEHLPVQNDAAVSRDDFDALAAMLEHKKIQEERDRFLQEQEQGRQRLVALLGASSDK